jgi:uncharacterized SAM-dependent methyltransferase
VTVPFPHVRGLRRLRGRAVVDLAESANLYLTERQGLLYERAIGGREYRKTVLGPIERAEGALPWLWGEAFGRNRKPVAIVDCGPGTAAEALRHLGFLHRQALVSRYVAVDVNPRLLSRVAEAVGRRRGVPINTICARFEDLTRLQLPLPRATPILLMLGSTIMNFEVSAWIELIRGLTTTGDYLWVLEVTAPARRPKQHASAYNTPAISAFTFEPLRLLAGRRQDFRSDLRWKGDRVEFGFRAVRAVTLGQHGIHLRRGDAVVTGFSRRPSLAEHRSSMLSLCRDVHSYVTPAGVVASLGAVGTGGRS